MRGVFHAQNVRVDPDQRRVWLGDDEVTFSRKEFDLLRALISRAGEVVSRDDLMREVWHTTFWTSSKTIDVHLGWIRRKLGDDSRNPHLITTLRGRGLRFETAGRRNDKATLSGDPAIGGVTGPPGDTAGAVSDSTLRVEGPA